MKVEQVNHPTTGNIAQDNDMSFVLKNEASFIDMALTKIYSNPIETIVRELLSNAIDSHRLAGHDKKIRVHLPTAIEPYFSVQDFGVGMNLKDIKEVYSVLGESTKNHTNDHIGGFGLGAKSPYAYTDSFTIESIKNGEKINILLYKDNSSSPKLNIATQEKTDEGSGVKVTVPVRLVDIDEFQTALDKYKNSLCSIKIEGSQNNFVIFKKEYIRELIYHELNKEEKYIFDSFFVDFKFNFSLGPVNWNKSKYFYSNTINSAIFCFNEIAYLNDSNVCLHLGHAEIESLTNRYISNNVGKYSVHFYFKTGYLNFNPTRESFIQDDKLKIFNNLIKKFSKNLFVVSSSQLVSYCLQERQEEYNFSFLLNKFNRPDTAREFDDGLNILNCYYYYVYGGRDRFFRESNLTKNQLRDWFGDNTILDLKCVSHVKTEEEKNKFLESILNEKVRGRSYVRLLLCFPNLDNPRLQVNGYLDTYDIYDCEGAEFRGAIDLTDMATEFDAAAYFKNFPLDQKKQKTKQKKIKILNRKNMNIMSSCSNFYSLFKTHSRPYSSYSQVDKQFLLKKFFETEDMNPLRSYIVLPKEKILEHRDFSDVIRLLLLISFFNDSKPKKEQFDILLAPAVFYSQLQQSNDDGRFVFLLDDSTDFSKTFITYICQRANSLFEKLFDIKDSQSLYIKSNSNIDNLKLWSPAIVKYSLEDINNNFPVFSLFPYFYRPLINSILHRDFDFSYIETTFNSNSIISFESYLFIHLVIDFLKSFIIFDNNSSSLKNELFSTFLAEPINGFYAQDKLYLAFRDLQEAVKNEKTKN